MKYICNSCQAVFCEEDAGIELVDLENENGVGRLFDDHHKTGVYCCPECGSQDLSEMSDNDDDDDDNEPELTFDQVMEKINNPRTVSMISRMIKKVRETDDEWYDGVLFGITSVLRHNDIITDTDEHSIFSEVEK